MELVPGTHTAPDTLVDALDGVTLLHITVTTGLAEVGAELVRRAVDAGVRRMTIVWGGFVGPAEQAVAESGVEKVLGRPARTFSRWVAEHAGRF